MLESDALQTTQSDAGEGPQPGEPSAEELAALLRGDDVEETDNETQAEGSAQGDGDQATTSEGEAGGEGREKKAKPTTLDELAEGSGLSVEELFSIKVNLGGDDGENIATLGELKDRVKEQTSFDVERLEFEDTKSKKEAEFLKAQADLVQLVSMLPREAISQEMFDRIAEQRKTEIAEQEAATLRTIREWEDDSVRDKDMTAMREQLGRYGFPEQYLDNVIDHRLLKFFRDSMKQQQRVDAMLDRVRRVRRTGHGQTKGASAKKTTSGHNPGKGHDEKELVTKVASIIRNG